MELVVAVLGSLILSQAKNLVNLLQLVFYDTSIQLLHHGFLYAAGISEHPGLVTRPWGFSF